MYRYLCITRNILNKDASRLVKREVCRRDNTHFSNGSRASVLFIKISEGGEGQSALPNWCLSSDTESAIVAKFIVNFLKTFLECL